MRSHHPSVEQRPVIAIVYTVSSRLGWRAAATRGGPIGEIIIADSLTHGLRSLGFKVLELGRLREFAAQLTPSRARPDVIFFDPWTLELACTHRLVGTGMTSRMFVLESFGTAPDMVPSWAPWLTPRRYLVPLPRPDYGWNTFLGFTPFRDMTPRVDGPDSLRDRIRACLRGKKRQGVIWAKEARFISEDVHTLIRSLTALCPMHATISVEKGFRVDLFPSGVANHGVLGATRFRALLAESSFILGVGDPISGFSAVDAMAAGCVVINPGFSPPRPVNGNARLPVTSQVPFAEHIGPPFVHTVNLADHAAALSAAATSFDIDATVHALLSGSGHRFVRALAVYTEPAYVERLRAIVASTQSSQLVPTGS